MFTHIWQHRDLNAEDFSMLFNLKAEEAEELVFLAGGAGVLGLKPTLAKATQATRLRAHAHEYAHKLTNGQPTRGEGASDDATH